MIFLKLFFEFALVGLFTFGGGMATLPLLTELGTRTGWFDSAFVTEMVAISESTPGPIGINMATYVGYNMGLSYGVPGAILGGIIASIAIALPCLIISIIVSRLLVKFSKNKAVSSAFYGIRPVVIALIIVAAISIISASQIISLPKIVFFAIILLSILKFKLHPIIYIAASAAVGIIFF